MNAATLTASFNRRIGAIRTTGAGLAVFAGTIFLSALLLFSVQPLFAKMVLPKLGGSPSVWAVSMCFFQAALLGGYCYAHALNRWLPVRMAPLVHLTLLAVAMLALPIGLPAFGHEPPPGDAYLWLIGVLTVGVGLPFFAVSANAPLLQAWFARTGHPHAADPYFLYAASNLGSLIALLAYPLLIEPAAGAVAQATMWTVGFAGLAATIAACAALIMAGEPVIDAAAHRTACETPAAPSWAMRAEWVGLAFVPSGLLVAFSTYVSTDIASAPLLWVLPLAWFLLTFVLVFRDRPLVPHGWTLRLQTVFVGATLVGLALPGGRGQAIATLGSIGAFVASTLVAHRELYERRPPASSLTEFYLWMSLGGMLGGIFAAIAAPRLFSNFWELPLLLVLGMLCRPGLAEAWRKDESRSEVGLLLAAVLAGCIAYAVLLKAGLATPVVLAAAALALVALVYAVGARLTPTRQIAAMVAAFSGLVILPSAMNHGDTMRSFFGVHRVAEFFDGQVRALFHGTTLHGSERLLDAEGRKVVAVPATYYHPAGPMAKGVEAARIATGKTVISVGIVGLGAGSMACHSRSGDRWRFYEIDPTVVRIARDPSRFTYLSRCRPDAEIVLGDARLTLTKAPPAGYDYLVVDAFSSDAVPAHLLSVEALRLYLSRLAPDGLLALHVSNRHLDLISVVSSLVAAVPGTHAVLAVDHRTEPSFDRTASEVVFIARREATLEPVKALPFTKPMPKAVVAPWTDDYSDLLGAMLRRRF